MRVAHMSGTTMFGLDLSRKLVVAVGGGAVGTRRARDLVQRGARVRVISPQISDDLAAMAAAGEVIWVRRDYAGAHDLAGAWLVHTATGVPLVDDNVARDADAAHTWCINASHGAGGSAVTPARLRHESAAGPIDVAITASGNPRRAASVKASIASAFKAGRIDTHRHRVRVLHDRKVAG